MGKRKEKLSTKFEDIMKMLEENGGKTTDRKYRQRGQTDEIAQKYWKFFEQREPKNLGEILYCMSNNIEKLPNCPNGNFSHFRAFYYGYDKTCKNFKECGCKTILKSNSMKENCKNRSKEAINLANEKRKETCLERYGEENVMHSDEIKERKDDLFFEKYGVRNPAHLDSVKTKRADTCMEKYGVKTNLLIEGFNEFHDNKLFEEEGIYKTTQRHFSELTREIIFDKEKLSEVIKNKTYLDIFVFFEGNITLKAIKNHIKKNDLMYLIDTSKIINFKTNNNNAEIFGNKEKFIKETNGKTFRQIMEDLKVKDESNLLTFITYHNCQKIIKNIPTRGSVEQRQIEYFLEDNNIEIITNKRYNFMNGKEIDIMIPELNIGIEYNGLFWHNINNQKIHMNYHYDKYNMCKQNNIQLLQIQSYELTLNEKYVKSYITHYILKQSKSLPKDCQILELSENNAKMFYKQNSILEENIENCKHFSIVKNNKTFGVFSYRENKNEIVLVKYSAKLFYNIDQLEEIIFSILKDKDIIYYHDNSKIQENMLRNFSEVENIDPELIQFNSNNGIPLTLNNSKIHKILEMPNSGKTIYKYFSNN